MGFSSDPIFRVFVLFACGCPVIGLVLVLVILPFWAKRRCQREHRALSTWHERARFLFLAQVAAFVPALIAGFALLHLVYPDTPPPRPTFLLSASLLIFVGFLPVYFLVSWWLMGWWGRRKFGLHGRSFLLPALVMATLAASATGGLFASLLRAQTLARRTGDHVRLASVGKGLVEYSHRWGTWPQDLRRLVDERLVGGETLRITLAPATRPYAGPCDFEYLPNTWGQKALICAWLDPKYNMGEVAFVLYGDGRVAELKPDQFAAELARTRQWLKEHAARGSESSTVPAAERQAATGVGLR